MLIVNADDYGMEDDVNRAVVRCFREGACTSTTIMANMPGFEQACDLAFENGFQRHVGLHLVLNEGLPLTSEIRKERMFCTEEGNLCLSRESPILSLSTRQRHALAAEIRGQIRRCRKRGLPISHVDSHHHVHTEWGIAGVLIPIVREERIPFVRIARNLVKNREIVKRAYKYFYNARLGWAKLRAARYFGSVDEYIHFLDAKGGVNGIIEVMTHPHYKGNDLYVTDSIGIGEYSSLMRTHMENGAGVSFRDLISRDTE
jgi:chitin disaccharide deacetylase